MHNPTTDIDQMIQELNAIQLPGSLMESFDAYREDIATVADEEIQRVLMFGEYQELHRLI